MIEVSCAIIMKDDRFLITQRSEQMTHPLKWEFPGGKVRSGELPEKCIQREIQEELNISIKVDRLLPSVVHIYPHQDIKLIPFVCSMSQGEISLSEHSSFQWVSVSQLSDYDFLDADLHIIECIKRKCTKEEG